VEGRGGGPYYNSLRVKWRIIGRTALGEREGLGTLSSIKGGEMDLSHTKGRNPF